MNRSGLNHSPVMYTAGCQSDTIIRGLLDRKKDQRNIYKENSKERVITKTRQKPTTLVNGFTGYAQVWHGNIIKSYAPNSFIKRFLGLTRQK